MGTINLDVSTGTQTRVAPPPPPEQRQAARQVGEAAVDLEAYPILTKEVDYNTPRQSTSTSAGGTSGAPIGQLIENAVRDVLGWRPDARNPAAFLQALNQAFTLKDVEGHVQWSWTPKSYAVQTDMGAVTGAQASIFNRARVALDQSLPLLNGLTSLRPEVLPEDLDSMRSVVRAQLSELVNEFGVLGGPRVQRVDQLFLQLLGDPNLTMPEDLVGNVRTKPSSLGLLGDRFGMERKRVNTVDDEQNLTNFLILADYVIGLNQSWKAQKGYFTVNGTGGGAEPFLGTQLVLLSRDFDVVAELVDEAYFAADSVFLGPAERGVLQLKLGGQTVDGYPLGASDLFLGDLLEWVDRVASQEAPQTIRDAGKDGVLALVPVLDQIRHLVRGALTTDFGGLQSRSIDPGYATPRVQLAVQTLADQLDQTYNDARKIRPAALLDVDEILQPEFLQNLSRLLQVLGDPAQATNLASAARKVAASSNGGR